MEDQGNNKNKRTDIKSKIAQAYAVDGTFKADDGKIVNYSQLHISFRIKGELFTVSLKIKQQERSLINLADDLEVENFLEGDDKGVQSYPSFSYLKE